MKPDLLQFFKSHYVAIFAFVVLGAVVILTWPKLNPSYAVRGYDLTACREAEVITKGAPKTKQNEIATCIDGARATSDLSAQWYAAQAAEDSVRLTESLRYLAILEAFGLLLTFNVAVWAARESGRAADHARDAVVATEKTGRDQSRAYLHVEAVEVSWGNADNHDPIIAYIVKNTGQTPAKWFEIKQIAFGIRIFDNNQLDARVFEGGPLDDAETYRSNSLGSQCIATFEWTPERDNSMRLS